MQTNTNGTSAPQGALANPIPITSLGVTQMFSLEEIRDRLAALTRPFPPELVEWRVTNTTRDRRGNRSQVVAYADPRAYTDRLNAILSPLGWTREYTVQTVQNFERPQRGDDGKKETTITAKVLVTCRVTLFGLGTHCGTGEEWATD
jgi:Rad52/22 family double-strand break repair protein